VTHDLPPTPPESSDSNDSTPAKANLPLRRPIAAKNKRGGEDKEEEEPVVSPLYIHSVCSLVEKPQSDWEASSSSEEEEDSKPSPSASPAPAPPPKKKGTLKAKLTAKEAEKAARKAADGDGPDYDSDEVLDPVEKARRDKQREVSSDLSNAADLFGAAAHGGKKKRTFSFSNESLIIPTPFAGTSSSELDWLISAQPRTKEDYQELSHRLIQYTIKRHQDKPLYAAFLEHHVRELAIPLRDVEVRKVATVLTTLANEKQKEQRDKASGKKKPKAGLKPVLGSSKVSSKCVLVSVPVSASIDFTSATQAGYENLRRGIR